jgi:hypothetical protein
LRLLSYLPSLSRNIPHEHRSKGPVLLAVDRKLDEDPALRVVPELSDTVGPLEVGQHEDVEGFGAGRWAEGVETLANSTLEFMVGGYAVRSSLRVSAFGRNTFMGPRAEGILQGNAVCPKWHMGVGSQHRLGRPCGRAGWPSFGLTASPRGSPHLL